MVEKRIRDVVLAKQIVLQPCPFMSGSEEKIRWLSSRVSHGLPLHHPFDNRLPIHPHNKDRNIRSTVNNRPSPDTDDYDEEGEDDEE